ncbi:MAG: hypothetical protein V2J02_15420 [Pseudomonadales bacterium]|jgi:hypothetical protein|nr:hypothetical protein [Pseudomonadales bacterium]
MQETVVIPERFRGPPQSGNGGYVGGVVAALFAHAYAGPDGAIEATLRAPIPLDAPLTVERDGADALRLRRGEQLIVDARRATLALTVPETPTLDAARSARDASPSFYRGVNPLVPGGTGFHPVCVCCGADVPAEEGLHVYAAPVPGFSGVAAAWRPPAALAAGDGTLPEAIVWTALDCPGQFAWMVDGVKTGLLGRMTGRVLGPVPADRDYLIRGWCLEQEGRKYFAGTALLDAEGTLHAFARQTWIGRLD